MMCKFYALITIYILINLLVYTRVWSLYNPTHQSPHLNSVPQPYVWISIARGSGAVIYLNVALVMISMMRVTLSRLKYSWIAQSLHLDHHIRWHIIFATGLCLGTLTHVLAYIGLALNQHTFWVDLILHQWQGWSLLLCLSIIFLAGQKCIRKSKKYELFYYSHYLFIVFLILLSYHARFFWPVMILPLCGYAGDRGYRFWCTFYPSQILSSKLWKAKIFELKISRPNNFRYHTGDYMFICIPQVSKTEWHPFTLSSDPNNLQSITIHFRIVGDWTHKVFDLCQTFEQQKLRSTSTHLAQPLVYLDGPLSAPASSMSKQHDVVLIAEGMGGTPFISHLKEILTQIQDSTYDFSRSVELFWIARNSDDYRWCNDEVLKPLFRHPLNPVKIYLLPKVITQDYHDWRYYLQNLAMEYPKIRQTVYVCGSSQLSQEVARTIKPWKWQVKDESF